MRSRRMILVMLVLAVALMTAPARSDTLWEKVQKSTAAALWAAGHPKEFLNLDKMHWECINDGPICYPSPTPP